ncbi:TRAP transporter small permease subunit [Thiomicrorhabdus sp. ZW0627]|uniref:TRAP transporter small permease subunit n=1 Tax=Thiomicrorhabdus sp. ZW0627 TaxID=3039774 RepID=UPI00243745C6|nr:TRAP transporter small permease subunit [Thiomicrorhabdus sp. ZW0627]MDG6774547.1 TRAP transporter small permease subunit [Thiomicrorhabdus sp. ZW0627]
MQFAKTLQRFISLQNRFQTQLGHVVAWGTLSLVVLMAAIVILRYGFNSGSIAMQEAAMYNHAILFMLGIAYTYQQDQHVRVDVFYANASPTRKAWINLIGTLLFAIPSMLFILWSGWDYVSASWAIKESSAEPGGLAYLYMLKTLILIMAGLVLMQSLAIAARAWLEISEPESLSPPEKPEVEGTL